MPRSRKAHKGCQTDYFELFERRLCDLENEISQLKEVITDLKSTNENLRRDNEHDEAINNLKHETEAQLKQLSNVIQSELYEELGEMKSTMSQLVNETDALNNLQQRTEVDIEQLQLNKQLEEKEWTLKSIEERVDDLEQNSKSANIRIFGIDEEEGEDLKSKVTNLLKHKLQVKTIQPEDIRDVGRMGKKKHKIRDILVKFKDNTIRDDIYNKRKLLKQDKVPIYINEDLTSQHSKLFFEARKLRKRKKIFGTWTQAGNIMIKVKDNDQPHAVKTYNELSILIEDEEPLEIL